MVANDSSSKVLIRNPHDNSKTRQNYCYKEQLQQYVTPATRIARAHDLVSNPRYVSIVSMIKDAMHTMLE